MNCSFKKPLYFYTKRAKTLKETTLIPFKQNYTNYTKWNLLTATAFSVEKFVFPLQQWFSYSLIQTLKETVFIKVSYVCSKQYKSITAVFLTKKETSVILM